MRKYGNRLNCEICHKPLLIVKFYVHKGYFLRAYHKCYDNDAAYLTEHIKRTGKSMCRIQCVRIYRPYILFSPLPLHVEFTQMPVCMTHMFAHQKCIIS